MLTPSQEADIRLKCLEMVQSYSHRTEDLLKNAKKLYLFVIHGIQDAEDGENKLILEAQKPAN